MSAVYNTSSDRSVATLDQVFDYGSSTIEVSDDDSVDVIMPQAIVTTQFSKGRGVSVSIDKSVSFERFVKRVIDLVCWKYAQFSSEYNLAAARYNSKLCSFLHSVSGQVVPIESCHVIVQYLTNPTDIVSLQYDGDEMTRYRIYHCHVLLTTIWIRLLQL